MKKEETKYARNVAKDLVVKPLSLGTEKKCMNSFITNFVMLAISHAPRKENCMTIKEASTLSHINHARSRKYLAQSAIILQVSQE